MDTLDEGVVPEKTGGVEQRLTRAQRFTRIDELGQGVAPFDQLDGRIREGRPPRGQGAERRSQDKGLLSRSHVSPHGETRPAGPDRRIQSRIGRSAW